MNNILYIKRNGIEIYTNNKNIFGNQYMEKVTPSIDDENKLNYYTDDKERNLD